MLKPWRENVVPHDDVLKGTFQDSEFSADLWRVHKREAKPEYLDPIQFFSRTYITEGMGLLLDGVIRRLSGKGGDPVIQLQTAFGGGKTHSMLAVYHLATATVSPDQLHGIATILDKTGIMELPKARVAIIDGIQLSPAQPTIQDGIPLNTLWGNIAWQIGGKAGYELVRESDISGTAPGKELLTQLLTEHAPVIILMDELVAFMRQLEDGKSLPTGTFDTNLTFLQALTEALKASPKCVLLASLPESNTEVGSSRGKQALDMLEKLIGRVHAIWKPVTSEESFEIVRRRLFSEILDPTVTDSVCRQFTDFYIENAQDFPSETTEMRYCERMRKAYPIHPEIFDRLYNDWSSLDKFQRTRGVLQLLAQVIYRLWSDENRDPLIMPGSLPLYDPAVRNKAIYYLPPGWDPVIERDIDGEKPETLDIERNSRFGAINAARRVARTIFLGSAPSSSVQIARGIEIKNVLLGSMIPMQSKGTFLDVLKELENRAHYLNVGSNRYWYDTRPTLRREMEDRKRRFDDQKDLQPELKQRLGKLLQNCQKFDRHIFPSSIDVPDEERLRLVVLPLIDSYSKATASITKETTLRYIKTRGDYPRQNQNRVLFLLPDTDISGRMRDTLRTWLAWKSIKEDVGQFRLNLDKLQERQVDSQIEDANRHIDRMLRETWKWLIIPWQEANPSQGVKDMDIEVESLSTSSPSLIQEIENRLQYRELVIKTWSPLHLATLLQKWFWKDDIKTIKVKNLWEKFNQYVYLPRLQDKETLQNAIEAGIKCQDFFGYANSESEAHSFTGFTFGTSTQVVIDDHAVLIEKQLAEEYLQQQKQKQEVSQTISVQPTTNATTTNAGLFAYSQQQSQESTVQVNTLNLPIVQVRTVNRFFGSCQLQPIQAKSDFNAIVSEIVDNFISKSGVEVEIEIEIRAKSHTGFDESLQRTIKENCNTLRFGNAEFE